MNNENDTLYAGKELEGLTAKKKEHKGIGSNVALGTVVGALGGAGGAYAVENYGNGEDIVAGNDVTTACNKEESQKVDNAKQEIKEETTTDGSMVPVSEEKEESEVKPEEAEEERIFFDEHKVKIDDIEVKTDKDGKLMHLATGEVDGHRAVFVEDGSGQVKGVVDDENDNGIPDENEYCDLSDKDVSLQDLADHKQE